MRLRLSLVLVVLSLVVANAAACSVPSGEYTPISPLVLGYSQVVAVFLASSTSPEAFVVLRTAADDYICPGAEVLVGGRFLEFYLRDTPDGDFSVRVDLLGPPDTFFVNDPAMPPETAAASITFRVPVPVRGASETIGLLAYWSPE